MHRLIFIKATPMDTHRLLFALHVRNLALELRSTARAAYYTSIFGTHTEADRQARLEAWGQEHPFDMFVARAVRELEHTARLIDDLNSAG